MVGSGQKNGRVLDGTLGSGADFSGGFPRAQLSLGKGSLLSERPGCRLGWQPRKAGVPIRGGWNLREQRERVGAVRFLGEGAFPDKPALAHLSPPELGVSWDAFAVAEAKGPRTQRRPVCTAWR